ncbi:hypothetical protein COO60DRAFT_409036 [Scenedesmus sp. NREL 46B-D3]|nr:hypothetical protein COO60DRAFT_409036 [Scenedesmus sp. NREL 46B-D3]
MRHALLRIPARPASRRPRPVAATLLLAVLLHLPALGARQAPAWALLGACLAAPCRARLACTALAALLARCVPGHVCVAGALGNLKQGGKAVKTAGWRREGVRGGDKELGAYVGGNQVQRTAFRTPMLTLEEHVQMLS